LDGGIDGLDVVRVVIDVSSRMLVKGGMLVIELGEA